MIDRGVQFVGEVGQWENHWHILALISEAQRRRSMQTFTTKVAAEAAMVHQQTVIRWAKEGLIEPSVPRPRRTPI